ncbi:glutathione S-transferase T3-like [Tripterygium wilfordii]|uniref:glutathione S-transferase T3-like n=1 Tax=Tripterygium wilfordii TaxID=458696 RepID=UPI0018F85BC0|nr:glutathione S-transferase T3-like [Tripterygium wilfordii]
MNSNSSGNCFFDTILDEMSLGGSQLEHTTEEQTPIQHTTEEQTPIQVEQSGKPKKNPRLGNFSTQEDLALVSAWLNTSLDAIQGTDQKGTTFWKRVSSTYHSAIGSSFPYRTDRSLINRWSNVQSCVNKFMGFLAQIETSRPSGVNEQDKIEMAKVMYRDIQKTTFQFEHCWNILRHQPKWLSHIDRGSTKRRSSLTNSPNTPESINLSDEMPPYHPTIDLERPIGQKAEKEKLRKGKNKDKDVGYLGDVISDLKTGKLKMHEQKMKMHEEKMIMAKIEIEKQDEHESKRIKLKEMKEEREYKRMKLQERQEEMNIMMMDLSSLSEDKAEYIKILRAEILGKKKNM